MRYNAIYLLLPLVLLISCGKTNTHQDLMSSYITDSLYSHNKVLDIEFCAEDSLYSSFYDTPTYKDIRRKLYDNYRNLEKEIKDYNYEMLVLHVNKPISGRAIRIYQNEIRRDLERLVELKKSYKTTFLGYSSYAKVTYSTDFNDSVSLVEFYLTPEKDKADIVSELPLDNLTLIDSLLYYMRQPNEECFYNLVDTTIFLDL